MRIWSTSQRSMRGVTLSLSFTCNQTHTRTHTHSITQEKSMIFETTNQSALKLRGFTKNRNLICCWLVIAMLQQMKSTHVQCIRWMVAKSCTTKRMVETPWIGGLTIYQTPWIVGLTWINHLSSGVGFRNHPQVGPAGRWRCQPSSSLAEDPTKGEESPQLGHKVCRSPVSLKVNGQELYWH